MKLKIFLFFLALSNMAFAQVDSILFLGNSYTAGNNLAGIFDNLSKAAGDTFFVESATQGGFTIQSHLNNAGHLAKIQERAWKYFIVQEQSQIPTIDHYFNTLSLPAARILESYARQQNNCSEVIFFMTWGRRFGGQQCDQNNVHCSVNFADFDHMQDTLKSRYQQLAREIGGGTSPVGEAWRIALADTSDLILHSSDNSHPNLMGSYLAACTHYASLTGKSPVGISYTAGINASYANYLQRKAAEAVLDSMSTFSLDTAQYPPFEMQVDAASYLVNQECKLDSIPITIQSHHQGQNPIGDSIPLYFKRWSAMGQLLAVDTLLIYTSDACRKRYLYSSLYLPWDQNAYYLSYELGLSGLNVSPSGIDTLLASPTSIKIIDSLNCYREAFTKTNYQSNKDRWAYTQSGASILGWNLKHNADSILHQTKAGGEDAVVASFGSSWTQWDLGTPCFELTAGDYVYGFQHTNDRLDPNSGAAFKVFLDSANASGSPRLLHDFGLRYDSTYQSFSDTFRINSAGNYRLLISTYGSNGDALLGLDDFELMRMGSQCQQIITLQEDQIRNHLELYPNPAQNYFILENTLLNIKPSKLRVFDQMGRQQLIQTEILSANKLKVKGLGPGLYLVIIEDSEGQFLRKKILIKPEL